MVRRGWCSLSRSWPWPEPQFMRSSLHISPAFSRELTPFPLTSLSPAWAPCSDHRVNMYTYKSCCSGCGLVDWVIAQSAVPRTRQQVSQMWQALLLEGVLQHSMSCVGERGGEREGGESMSKREGGREGAERVCVYILEQRCMCVCHSYHVTGANALILLTTIVCCAYSHTPKLLFCAGHKVHPFLDNPQLFYKFCELSPAPSETSAPVIGTRLQQLKNLFSFSRNSTPSGSPAASPTPRRRPQSAGDILDNTRPR